MLDISWNGALRAMAGAFAFVTLGQGALAQTDWKAEWDKTVAAAKKEGSVILGMPSSAIHREFVQKAWTKAYPEIELQMTTAAGGTWVPRVKIERGANKFLWDAALTGADACFDMKDAGFLDPIVPELIPPDIKDPKTWGGWQAAFIDREAKYVFASRSFLKMPYFNAKMLSPEKVKRMGAKVLLDPEVKGKVVWHDPLIPGSGESFPPVLRRVLGDENLKTFVQEQVLFTGTFADVVEKMARGQHAIGMGPVITNLLDKYKSAGLDLDIRPLGNTPEYAAYGNTGASNMIVIKDRPHPNATRVFINWYLSKEVATELGKAIAEDSRRVDIPSQDPPELARVPGVAYFEAQREEHREEFAASHAYIRQLRGK